MTPDLLADDTEQQHILDPQPGDPGYGDVGPPPPAPPAPAAPARPRSWLAAIVATAVLAGAGAGAGVSALMHNDSTTTVVSPSTSASGSRNSSVIAKPSDVQGILAKVGPAVAYVRTQAFQSGRFFPSSGAGTGIVLTPDGELLTNAHVVAGATSIKVTVGTDTQSHNATVIGADTNNDLALVKISGVSNLPVADLGSSSALKVGDNVIAIGNALNLQGGMTVTEGIVSALNRSIDATDESLSGLIQTDAAINPGNSGGPLVNSAGQVVGINTATSGDAQNIGFAIAIDKAKPVIDQLKKGGGSSSSSGSSTQQASSAFLGVSVTDGQTGALVADVDPTSPAGRAGIQQGDQIVSLGGKSVQSADDLTSAMRSHKPGDRVTVTFLRGQSRQSADVQLASRQASS